MYRVVNLDKPYANGVMVPNNVVMIAPTFTEATWERAVVLANQLANGKPFTWYVVAVDVSGLWTVRHIGE